MSRLVRTKKLELKQLHGAPVISCEHVDAGLERIFGFQSVKHNNRVVFPAYLPFIPIVRKDFRKVYRDDEIELSSQLKDYLDYVERQQERMEKGKLPSDVSFITDPYEHQWEGIVKCYYNYRWGIFYDTGLGKTKILCDIIRMMKKKHSRDYTTLVVCPSHLLNVWKAEMNKHSGDNIDTCIIARDTGDTLPPKKRKELYAGKSRHHPTDDHPWVDKYPYINYTGFDEDVPEDKYEELEPHIEAYLKAVQNDDKRDRRNARNRIISRCKKWGIDYPDTAKKVDKITPADNYDVVAVGYSVAKNDKAWLKNFVDYDMMICDESHNLGGPRSQRTQDILELSSTASRRYLLTGTPSMGAPKDLWGQLKFLGDFLVPHWWKYKKRYMVTHPKHEHMVLSYKNLFLLNREVSRTSTRKKKEECLDLPDRQFIHIPVHLDKYTKDAYNDMVSKREVQLPDSRVLKADRGTRIVKMQQILSGFVKKSKDAEDVVEGLEFDAFSTEDKLFPFDNTPRLDVLKDLLENILSNDDNHSIIWCKFTYELDTVEQLLQDKDIGYIRVDGNTKDKKAAEEEFNHNDECRVYLSQLSIGEGLTLNAANYMIWYGLTYSMKEWKQALGRNARIGQDQKLFVYLLYTPHSIQEDLVKALDRKEEVSKALTDVQKCGTCKFADECREKGIRPFSEECIYDSSQKRVVTKPKLIP